MYKLDEVKDTKIDSNHLALGIKALHYLYNFSH